MENLAPRKPRSRLVLGAALGLTVSIVLQIIHARTYLAPSADSYCSFDARFDCALVAASPSSVFFLPWATWGVLGFTSILIAALRRSIWLLPLTAVAALVSIALFGVSSFYVGSICIYCEFVHVISLVLAFLTYQRRQTLVADWKNPLTLQLLFVLPGTLALTLWLFLPRYWSSFSYLAPPPFATGTTSEGHPWIGAENREVTVVEVTSYQCPHCKVATTRSLRMLEAHPEIRLVRRQQPITRCRDGSNDCEWVRAAFCAGDQGKFWQADRWLFAHVRPKVSLLPLEFAEELELDVDALRACLRDSRTFARAQAERDFVQKFQLTATPSYFNGTRRLTHKEAAHFLESGEMPSGPAPRPKK